MRGGDVQRPGSHAAQGLELEEVLVVQQGLGIVAVMLRDGHGHVSLEG